MFSWPHLAAGPVGDKLANTIVGNIDPHPLSTITTPKISPFAFGTTTYNRCIHFKTMCFKICAEQILNRSPIT